MHPEFPQWYSHVDMTNDSEIRKARWAAIDRYLDCDGEIDLDTLLKLAYDFRKKPTDNQIHDFRQCFREFDERFPTSGNERELKLLAVICLAQIVENNSYNQSAEAALSIITADFNGAREIPFPINLVGIARQSMQLHGRNIRQRSNCFDSSPNIGSISLKGIIDRDAHDYTEVADAFPKLESIINTTLVPQIRETIQANIEGAKKLIEIQDEELQMLWWFVGQYSHSIDCTFDKLEADIKPLILAAELSETTTLIPEPMSIKPLLSRAGLAKQKKKIKLTSAINSAPEEWLKSQTEGKKICPLTTPIHFAIERQLETGSGESWIAGWSASTNINENISLTPLDLSLLYYRESLLTSLEYDG